MSFRISSVHENLQIIYGYTEFANFMLSFILSLGTYRYGNVSLVSPICYIFEKTFQVPSQGFWFILNSVNTMWCRRKGILVGNIFFVIRKGTRKVIPFRSSSKFLRSE